MSSRITDFMETNSSIYEMQYGFHSGRSCEHALLKAQSILLDSLNKKEIALLLLIDFSNAFDMVEHDILLNKLQHYGIRGKANDWLRSYLGNREQYVTIDGKESSKKYLKFGVPQGSILGPLLFIIYINDIPGILKLAKFILYADDANIILTGENMQEIEEKFTKLANVLVEWVDSNGLALNLKKTNYMIFSKQKICSNFAPLIANTFIERKTSTRFLGVIVDDQLNWSEHITALKTKMARYVGIMFKIKSFLPMAARLQIFHSFVQSHINYCSLVWGFASKSNIESIFTIQKKSIRAIMPGFVNYFYKDGIVPEHTKPFFAKYNILTVQGVIVKNTLIFMQKIHKYPSNLPLSLRETIADDSPTHGSTYETCQEWLTRYNIYKQQKSIFYKGPMLYIQI